MSSENINNFTANSDEISLKELILKIKGWFDYLLSKWLVIIGFGILGGILGFVYAYFKKTTYTATTTFVLENGENGGIIGQYAGLASMAGIDIGGGGGGLFQGDNIIELYKSRTMIKKTLFSEVDGQEKRQLLIDRYIEFNHLRESWNKNTELKDMQFSNSNIDNRKLTRAQDSILNTIVADISKNYLNVLKPDKKLSLINVEIKAPDEFFAKAFNNQMVKEVNDFYIQTKTKKSLENVSILQQKVDSVRTVMNGNIYSAASVADATPNLNPTRQTQRIAPIQLSQFSAETNKAILGELVKNLELSKIALRKEAPLIQVVDQPVYPLSKTTFGKSRGIVIGCVLFGALTVIILTLKLIFKNIMESE